MIKSMTAFARAEGAGSGISVTVEIRSYNSRFLDINLRIPQEYQTLEDQIKAVISGITSRGRIEVRIEVNHESEMPKRFEVDAERAKSLYTAVNQLKEMFSIDEPVQLDTLLWDRQLIRPVELNPDTNAQWPVIRDIVTDAMNQLDAMRKKEGIFIAEDFKKRLNLIETQLDYIESESADLLPIYQHRLKERIESLTRGMVEIDPSRIAQEAAFLADRSDITEELVRARSHVEQFRTIMDAKEASGRKLNFLIQELNREFNTMGAKTSSSAVSHRVVEIKSELEKLREQVQNVE